jgi:formate dehydrogenase subunit gamma
MSSAVPLAPVPLSSEEARAMRHRTMKKHHIAIMLVHWFNAATWILELTTGAALITSRLFRVAPDWYTMLFTGVFGTRANLLRFHVALGTLWVVVLLPYAVFGFRNYLSTEILNFFERDDRRWLLIRLRMILRRTDEPLPPQGAYNAGQKAFALVVWSMVPVVAATGLVMAYQLLPTRAVGWSVVIHYLAVGAVVSGLFIHVYMGAVFPEEKPAFFSMITGNVNELFAYRHHFKWWRDVKLAEQARERKEPPEPLTSDQPASPQH